MAHQFWQPDPTGRHRKRWRNRDGTWGDRVNDRGVMSLDSYEGPQPSPDTNDPAQTAELPQDAPAAPVTVQMLDAARAPLGFWRTALAVAVGVLIAAAVGLVALAALAEQALQDL